jgi:geranylgeranyl pyrophosphate synthase
MHRQIYKAAHHHIASRSILIRRQATYESIEKAVGRQAAHVFLESMDLNSKSIDVPTISLADPSTMSDWRWATGLDRTPKLELEDLKHRCKFAIDPFKMVEKDLSSLSGGIKELLGSDHPVLESCAKYFFEVDGGKKIRSTMVLAISYALGAGKTNHIQIEGSYKNLTPDSTYEYCQSLVASPSQKRLAEITEMIHTASLFHDDVIDKAETRRNVPSVNQVFGNKVAILGGDFLLSRASVSLARLRNLEVVELLSTVIEHLVKGEIMQIKPVTNGISGLEYYLRKNFYKTASLMGNSCLAAAVLGEYSDEYKKASYLYGVHLGCGLPAPGQ